VKKTLVFGASLKPYRYSHMAMKNLVGKGIDVVGFGSAGGTVNGVEITTRLQAFEFIHTISLYMAPANQKAFYDYLIGLKPQRVIFNPGSENPEFKTRLMASGISVVEGCTLVMLSMGDY
jgi:predicted CoA-binding protein